jgi:chemotaxis protein histidine kinase CheA
MPALEGFGPEEMKLLREIFLTSSGECLATVGSVLTAWRDGAIDEASLRDSHRAVHSIKGAALQIGYVPIGNLAKAMEGVILAGLRLGAESASEWLPLIERGVDALAAQLAAVREEREIDSTDPWLMSEFDRAASDLAARAA